MKTGKGKKGCCTLEGFHHDEQEQLEKQEKIYYSAGQGHAGFRERFIACSRQQFPVYKTTFSSSLSREAVILMMIEALKNIKSIEDQDHVFKIEGLTKKNMSITTVIKKKDNTVATFYPTSPKTKAEIDEKTNELKAKFTKFFFNPLNKPIRQPISKEESEQLLALSCRDKD